MQGAGSRAGAKALGWPRAGSEERKEVGGESLCIGRGKGGEREGGAPDKVSRGEIRVEGYGEDLGFYWGETGARKGLSRGTWPH